MPRSEAVGLTSGVGGDGRSAEVSVQDSGDEEEPRDASYRSSLVKLVPMIVVAGGICALTAAAVASGSPAASKRASGFAIDTQGVESLAASRSSGRYIRWKEHPEKCMDVWGDHAGAMIQLWACNDFHGAGVRKESEFKWILPAEGVPGSIVWAGNTSYCLNAPTDTKLQIWYCDTAPVQHTRWKITADGRIHLAYHFGKCLDVPGGETSMEDGIKLQLWDCMEGDTAKEGNVLFDVYPQDCQWSLWSDWSACSLSCGGGMRYQARRYQQQAVNGGQDCVGQGTRAEACGTSECPKGEEPPASGRGAGGSANHQAPHGGFGSVPGEGGFPTPAPPTPPTPATAAPVGGAPVSGPASPPSPGSAPAPATQAPEDTTFCHVKGKHWEPLSMEGQDRTKEESRPACQARCAGTSGCAHFSFWPDGGCHVQDDAAKEKEDDDVWSGPPVCQAPNTSTAAP